MDSGWGAGNGPGRREHAWGAQRGLGLGKREATALTLPSHGANEGMAGAVTWHLPGAWGGVVLRRRRLSCVPPCTVQGLATLHRTVCIGMQSVRCKIASSFSLRRQSHVRAAIQV